MNFAELLLRYIDVLIWPAVTLYILIGFRKEIGRLFERAKRVQLPGGISIEAFEDKLQKAKLLEQEIRANRKSDVPNQATGIKKGDTEANRHMIGLGLRPSPSGLNLGYYTNIAESDITLAMAGLRMDLELMLRNLAKGYSIEIHDKSSSDQLIDSLLNAGAINKSQSEFVRIIFQLTNFAIHGGKITIRQFEEVIELAKTLVEDYVLWLKNQSNPPAQ